MKLSSAEQYISVDVETTGYVPGLYSMIDLGACWIDDINNCFSVSLKEDPQASRSAKTMEWWMSSAARRQTFDTIQERAEEPVAAMLKFKKWLTQFPKPVFVAFPAGFDFPFIRYYWFRWLDDNPPFGHQCLDGKTLAMIKLNAPEYKKTSKKFMHRKFPSGFRSDLPHNHFAVDDAKEQAYLFSKLLAV